MKKLNVECTDSELQAEAINLAEEAFTQYLAEQGITPEMVLDKVKEMEALETIYVLLDNSQHEPKVVGVYHTHEQALAAWTKYADEQNLDDEQFEQFSIQAAPLARK